ncbi:hypothetical protein HAZT_HAZT011141 [Hyalella azteca]|uniref:Uncharacterized protein n=1 Tax=Hyalella azteca TaxID=294128 RepID=A0A6A0GUM3_HYAAZ|nr:hypothetical protein HAZT_HAZT011141 [Hyalella azteca]
MLSLTVQHERGPRKPRPKDTAGLPGVSVTFPGMLPHSDHNPFHYTATSAAIDSNNSTRLRPMLLPPPPPPSGTSTLPNIKHAHLNQHRPNTHHGLTEGLIAPTPPFLPHSTHASVPVMPFSPQHEKASPNNNNDSNRHSLSSSSSSNPYDGSNIIFNGNLFSRAAIGATAFHFPMSSMPTILPFAPTWEIFQCTLVEASWKELFLVHLAQ